MIDLVFSLFNRQTIVIEHLIRRIGTDHNDRIMYPALTVWVLIAFIGAVYKVDPIYGRDVGSTINKNQVFIYQHSGNHSVINYTGQLITVLFFIWRVKNTDQNNYLLLRQVLTDAHFNFCMLVINWVEIRKMLSVYEEKV